MTRDAIVKAFEMSLATSLGRNKYPGTLPVDLDDLLGTLERVCERLREIAFKGQTLSFGEMEKALMELRIVLKEDVGGIVDDLIPQIRKTVG